MLGALLLTVTGRARRIEAAVQRAHRRARARDRASARAPRAPCATASSAFATSSTTLPIGVVYTDLRGHREADQPGLLRDARLQRGRPARHDGARTTRIPMTGRRTLALVGRGWSPASCRCTATTSACSPRDGRTLWVRSSVSLLRDAGGAAAPHRRRGGGHHRTPAAGGGRAGARAGRVVQPREERVPVAHEPRAAHAAERDARLRAAARARPAPPAGRRRSGPGWRRSRAPAGTCWR